MPSPAVIDLAFTMLPGTEFPEAAWVDDFLKPDERIRVREYRRADDRWRFLLGRALARHLLHTQYGLTALAFIQDRYGRPRLRRQARTGIDFNISHAGRWIGCATSSQGRIGIDLVRTADFENWLEFAERYLATEERRALARHDGLAARALAARYWAAKEAILKAVGTGFACDPRSLALDLGEGIEIKRTPESWGRCNFVIREQPVAPGYISCIALIPAHCSGNDAVRSATETAPSLIETYIHPTSLIGHPPVRSGENATAHRFALRSNRSVTHLDQDLE